MKGFNGVEDCAHQHCKYTLIFLVWRLGVESEEVGFIGNKCLRTLQWHHNQRRNIQERIVCAGDFFP